MRADTLRLFGPMLLRGCGVTFFLVWAVSFANRLSLGRMDALVQIMCLFLGIRAAAVLDDGITREAMEYARQLPLSRERALFAPYRDAVALLLLLVALVFVQEMTCSVQLETRPLLRGGRSLASPTALFGFALLGFAFTTLVLVELQRRIPRAPGPGKLRQSLVFGGVTALLATLPQLPSLVARGDFDLLREPDPHDAWVGAAYALYAALALWRVFRTVTLAGIESFPLREEEA